MGEEPGTFESAGRLLLSGDDRRPAPLDAANLALELGGPAMPVYASSVGEDAPISESTVAELVPNGPFVRR